MKTSEDIKDLTKALAAAQADMKDAALNAENPHLKSKYANWSSIRAATVPALAQHGLAISQSTEVRDGALLLLSRMMHTSGQWLSSEYPLPMVVEKPQVMGSALTYAKRYSWALLCGIAAGEDDDANAAEAVSGTRSWGKAEPVVGALNKTALQAKMREFDEALSVCGDEDQLYGLLRSYDEALKQCARDLPSWWLTKQGADTLGISDRIEEKKKALEPKREF